MGNKNERWKDTQNSICGLICRLDCWKHCRKLNCLTLINGSHSTDMLPFDIYLYFLIWWKRLVLIFQKYWTIFILLWHFYDRAIPLKITTRMLMVVLCVELTDGWWCALYVCMGTRTHKYQCMCSVQSRTRHLTYETEGYSCIRECGLTAALVNDRTKKLYVIRSFGTEVCALTVFLWNKFVIALSYDVCRSQEG